MAKPSKPKTLDDLFAEIVKVGAAVEKLHDQNYGRFNRVDTTLENMGKKMDAQTQAIIDRLTAIKSVVDGIKASSTEKDAIIQDLKTKNAELQAKVDAGDSITKEDLDAISAKLGELEAINTADPVAIPANTGVT